MQLDQYVLLYVQFCRNSEFLVLAIARAQPKTKNQKNENILQVRVVATSHTFDLELHSRSPRNMKILVGLSKSTFGKICNSPTKGQMISKENFDVFDSI